MAALKQHKIFELNSATKVEFCLLKWTAVNGSNYSFQVFTIIVRLCIVVLLYDLELCKEKRPPGRNLGEYRSVRCSGTTSRGTVALVFC